MWKFWKEPSVALSAMGDWSGSTAKLTVNGKDDGNIDESNLGYGSIVQLAPPSEGSLPPDENWWQRRKKRIFRKKTLYKRFPIIQWLPKYNLQDLVADFVAGITVGVTLIPQALGYASVAGLPPQYGLYSAYIGCFVYVILGSTKPITIGPTALLGLLTHEGVLKMGPGAAVFLAFFAGCIELVLGLLNFGFLIDFIAAPVIAGFTAAAAFTIGSTQIKSLLGLKFEADGFVSTWQAVGEHIEETRLGDALLGFSSMAFLLLLRPLERIKLGKEGNRTTFQTCMNNILWFLSTSRNAVVIIIGAIIAASLTSDDPEIKNPFILTGNITAGLAPFQPPPFFIENGNQTFNFAEICQNLGSALFITPLIAILESVAIAKSFSKGQRVDASQEMIAIGTSNILGSFVSSFPVTGSFSRTAVNAASGVHTPFNGIYTGTIVLLATSVLTPYLYFIPKSCLAAVIIIAVIFMIDVHLVVLVWRSRKLDLVPLFVTFFFCVFLSLEYGILIGIAVNLAMLLYATGRPKIQICPIKGQPNDYLLITPDRSLVFTAMDNFMSIVRKALIQHRNPPITVVIDMGHVSMVDFSTAYGFHLLTEEMQKGGHQIILTKTKARVLGVLLGIGTNFHIHHEGSSIEELLKGIEKTPENKEATYLEEITLPPTLTGEENSGYSNSENLPQ